MVVAVLLAAVGNVDAAAVDEEGGGWDENGKAQLKQDRGADESSLERETMTTDEPQPEVSFVPLGGLGVRVRMDQGSLGDPVVIDNL